MLLEHHTSLQRSTNIPRRPKRRRRIPRIPNNKHRMPRLDTKIALIPLLCLIPPLRAGCHQAHDSRTDKPACIAQRLDTRHYIFQTLGSWAFITAVDACCRLITAQCFAKGYREGGLSLCEFGWVAGDKGIQQEGEDWPVGCVVERTADDVEDQRIVNYG